MRSIYSIFSLVGLMCCSFGNVSELVYPDFKTSMLREIQGNSQDAQEREVLYESFNKYYLDVFESIYNKNILAVKQSSEAATYRIPRIIHQICLRSEIPERCQEWMQKWSQLEGWEYKLWTEKEIKQLKLYNQDVFNKSKSIQEKSDILRLEILSRYGGVYISMDYECTNPEIFEELNKNFDFYIGFEPIEHGRVNRFNMFKVCNAVIGSVPYHPLVRDMIVNLKASYLAYQCCGVIERTGPAYFTRIICEYASDEYTQTAPAVFRTVYLPSTFFYPVLEKDFIESDRAAIESKLFPETAGMQHWNKIRPKSKT